MILQIFQFAGCTKKNNGENLMLNFHIPVRLAHLDPHRMEDAYSMMINIQIYRSLFRYLADGQLKPDFVDKYEVSADRLHYTFHLRENIFFSDKSPITSKHVQHSLARIFSSGASIGADLDYIKGAEKFKKSKDLNDFGFIIKSDKTFEITLDHPTNVFIKHLATADCAILPITDFKTDKLPNIYSGPYEVNSFSAEEVILKKWRKDIFDSKNPPQSVRLFYTLEEPSKLSAAHKTDWVVFDHIAENVQTELMKQGWFQTSGEMALENFLIASPKHYSFPLRKKIYSVLTKFNLIEKLDYPGLEKAYGLIPPFFGGGLDKTNIESVEKLAENTQTFSELIELEFNKDIDITTQTAKHIAQVLTENGLKVKLVPLAADELLDRMFSKKGHLILGRKGIDYPDAISILNYFKAGVENNYFYTESKTLPALINKIIVNDSAAEKTNLVREAQIEILKEFTTIPLFFGTDSSSLWSSKLVAVPPFPAGPHMIPVEMLEVK